MLLLTISFSSLIGAKFWALVVEFSVWGHGTRTFRNWYAEKHRKHTEGELTKNRSRLGFWVFLQNSTKFSDVLQKLPKLTDLRITKRFASSSLLWTVFHKLWKPSHSSAEKRQPMKSKQKQHTHNEEVTDCYFYHHSSRKPFQTHEHAKIMFHLITVTGNLGYVMIWQLGRSCSGVVSVAVR